jgi:hypothetical protein
MYVRLLQLLYVLVIVAAVLVGTVGQQLLALAVAGVLVSRRALIVRTDRQPVHR